MKDLVLGFDTSNYRTSVAAVTLAGQIIVNSRMLLPVKSGERGLRQSDALYLHLKQIARITAPLREAVQDGRIVAVGASCMPRNRSDSYMPVFEVGKAVGKTIADTLNVPFFQTDHQSGHVRAAAYGTDLENEARFMAFHLSGGTMELLKWEDGCAEILGRTLDLNAGQLVDRVGVAMGLPFPAGPELEKMALRGTARGLLGVSMENGDLDCHLSGAESQIQRWLKDGNDPWEDLAREIYDLLARTVARMLEAGRKKTGLTQALIAGGVSASALFRQELIRRLEKHGNAVRPIFGDPELSGDNAVGVALIAADRFRY